MFRASASSKKPSLGMSAPWRRHRSPTIRDKWITRGSAAAYTRSGIACSKIPHDGRRRGWYERAANAKEKGDVQGRINYESLARSLGEVGNCLLRTGRFLEARPWYERAATAHEKGDPYGRYDYESLGSSLHQIGFSFLSVGEVEQGETLVRTCGLRAKEKGDFFGRVDHESLGRTLEGLGDCQFLVGKTVEARASYSRAIDAHEKGDVHGRVDYEHLGLCLHQLGCQLRLLADFKEAIACLRSCRRSRPENGDFTVASTTMPSAKACSNWPGASRPRPSLRKRGHFMNVP